MNNLHVLSEYQLRQATDVIQDLVALVDPSNYLITEAQEVIRSLKESETITTEAYTTINEDTKV